MQTNLNAQCVLPSKTLARFLKTAVTPLFLYDEKSLVQAAQALFRAFSDCNGFLPRFPIRMNPNPTVLQILRSCGCGVLCRSLAELELAARCGFHGRKIAYEPSIRSAEAEKAVHTLGAVFVLDGAELLPEAMPEAVILLLRQQGQLRFGAKPVTGVPASYAGMEREALLRTAECLRAGGVGWLGLGMRLGELCMDEDFYPAIFAQLAALAQTLYEKTDAAADAIDLGGGFGVSYRPGFSGPEPDACAKAILTQIQALPEALRGLSLQMSPGRFLAAACGTLVISDYMPETVSDSTLKDNLKLFGQADRDDPSYVLIYADTFASKDEISSMISDYNAQKTSEGREEDVIHYTDYVALMMSSISTIINVISYVLIAFVSISLVVSSIMIGIITYISVLERTKEIGILRAVGASKKDISRVFNAETLIIGFTAGAIGIGITLLLCIPANIIIKSLTDISNLARLPAVGGVALVLISMLLTTISGLIPSHLAAKKDPVEALRNE